MGKPRPPEKALLFVATLYKDHELYVRARNQLIKEFGSCFFESTPHLWNHTEYYREELGWPISRRFLAFSRIISPEQIRDIKIMTNGLEDNLAEAGKRKVNLDPGYFTLSKVVLATTKNYAHRIYLGKGIYAEVTLFYKQGTFRPHEFTYRDFRSVDYVEMFNKLREHLKERHHSERSLTA